MHEFCSAKEVLATFSQKSQFNCKTPVLKSIFRGCLKCKTPLDRVQYLMGDSTPMVVLNVYNHVNAEDTVEFAHNYFNSEFMA